MIALMDGPRSNELLAFLAQRGDEAARVALCQRMRGILYRQACRLRNSATDVEDLMQEGQIGLLQAIARFDASRQLKFLTFANPRIHGAMVDYLRQHGRLIHHPRLALARGEPVIQAVPIPMLENDHGDGSAWEFPAPASEGEQLRERREAVEVHLGGLLPRERRAVLAYYVDELTMKQVAAELGLSESRVSQLLSSIYERLRDLCSQE